MKKLSFAALAALFLMCSFSLQSPVSIDIDIDIAPNVLNIGSSGTVVTVHTDIAYSAVDGASCFLNGLEIDYWKSDSRGQFVAKFDIAEVKGLPDLNLGGMNTFTMLGQTNEGVEFSGTQEIKVVSVVPKGKK